MKLLNIGCGACCHPDWINIDLTSKAPGVIVHDLTKGLPYPADSIDVCYSSHVLEHLRPEEAEAFLSEQRRVLKKGGIIRVVAPDLEQICRLYLQYLDQVKAGNLAAEFQYDYSLLELFDQTTRERSGGQLRQTWNAMSADGRSHAIARHGKEVDHALERTVGGLVDNPTSNGRSAPARQLSLRKLLKRGRSALGRSAIYLLMGNHGVNALHEGLFRNSGEIHRVMYDSFRLSRLLNSVGFREISICQAKESRIPLFSDYQLDSVGDEVRKPDSLFMEAVK
jgi:predicted SAM-dependent methyltransferase